MPKRILSIWLLAMLVAAMPLMTLAQPRSEDLVARMVLDRAAVLAQLSEQYDRRERQLLLDLATRDRRIRDSLLSAAANTSEVERLMSELAALTGERETLTATLTASDAAIAADLQTYRERVTSLYASPDPRRRAALERYASGDRANALSALVDLQEAETLAVAAGWREIASLADDMKDRGEFSGPALIQIYERITALDPTLSADWTELSELRRTSGEIRAAMSAAEQGLERAQTDRQTAIALHELGMVAAEIGDHDLVRSSYQRALGISRRLVAASPNDADMRDNLFVSLTRLADAAETVEDKRRYAEECVEVARQNVLDNPTNTYRLRQYAASLDRLGELRIVAGDLAGALRVFSEERRIFQDLVNKAPEDVNHQRDLSISLRRLGDVWGAQGEHQSALDAYTQSLSLRRHLTAIDPDSTQYLFYAAETLAAMGEVHLQTGHVRSARAAFEESAVLLARRVAVDPDNLEFRANAASPLLHLGDMLLRDRHWSEALRLYNQHQEIYRGLLAQVPESFSLLMPYGAVELKIGRALTEQGDRSRAMGHYQTGHDIFRQLVANDAENVFAWHWLAVALLQIADLHARDGALRSAEVALNESRRIRADLVRRDPSNATFRNGLAESETAMRNLQRLRSR